MKLILISTLIVLFSFNAYSQAEGRRETGRQNVLFQLHKPMYLLPYTHVAGATNARHSSEIKAVFSFKIPLTLRPGSSAFNFAYNHKIVFQAYDVGNSRPMRNNDYNPQFFYRLQLKNSFLDSGYEHESNGKEDPSSRSWDRLFIAGTLYGSFIDLSLKFWYLLNEDQGADKDRVFGKERSIIDYYGHGELGLVVKTGSVFTTFTGMYNWDTGFGGLQTDITFPLNNLLFWHIQYYTGYGDNLLDYNRSIERYGIGVSINR